MFLDTNVLIGLLNNTFDTDFKIKLLSDIILKKVYISSIVYTEVLAFSDYSELEARDLGNLIKRQFKIIKPTNKMFDLAAKIARLQKQKTSKKLKLTDAIIAATAIEKNIPLLTLDREDFKNVEGLSLI